MGPITKSLTIFWVSLTVTMTTALPLSPTLSQQYKSPIPANKAFDAALSATDPRSFLSQLLRFNPLASALGRSPTATDLPDTPTTAAVFLPQGLATRDADTDTVIECTNLDELMEAFVKHQADPSVKFSAPTKVWDLAYTWLGFGEVGIDGARVLDSDTGGQYA